jgi:tRNA pseudouridine55 synthase
MYGNAVLLINKTEGVTSFDVVSMVRRLLHQRKIGHSGTLDKFASGLLVLCTGASTKLTRYFLESDKRYRAVIQLGIVTDTDDPTGAVLEERPVPAFSREDILRALDSFRGEQLQYPPRYSALKVSGKRASDLARSGGEVDLQPRRVIIREMELNSYDPGSGRLSIDVVCSKGTYIRSIARDLGEKLHVGGHCCELVRLGSGSFGIKDAVTVDELKLYLETGQPEKKFHLSPGEALAGFRRMVVNRDAVRKVFNGASFPETDIISVDESGERGFIILDEDENLIAIADIDIDKWQIKYNNVFKN